LNFTAKWSFRIPGDPGYVNVADCYTPTLGNVRMGMGQCPLRPDHPDQLEHGADDPKLHEQRHPDALVAMPRI